MKYAIQVAGLVPARETSPAKVSSILGHFNRSPKQVLTVRGGAFSLLPDLLRGEDVVLTLGEQRGRLVPPPHAVMASARYPLRYKGCL